MTPNDFDFNTTSDVPTLTPTTARILIGIQLAQLFPYQDQHTVALLADHIVTATEQLHPDLRQITRAELTFVLDPEDHLVNLVAQLPDVHDQPTAGVTTNHLGTLLIQDQFAQSLNDYQMRRNIYAMAYRALLHSQGEYDASQSFDEAVELATTALQHPRHPRSHAN